jgi:hypothetical protein
VKSVLEGKKDIPNFPTESTWRSLAHQICSARYDLQVNLQTLDIVFLELDNELVDSRIKVLEYVNEAPRLYTIRVEHTCRDF